MPMDIERRTAYELREEPVMVDETIIIGETEVCIQIEGDGAMLISSREGDKTDVVYLRAEALVAVNECLKTWREERK